MGTTGEEGRRRGRPRKNARRHPAGVPLRPPPPPPLRRRRPRRLLRGDSSSDEEGSECETELEEEDDDEEEEEEGEEEDEDDGEDHRRLKKKPKLLLKLHRPVPSLPSDGSDAEYEGVREWREGCGRIGAGGDRKVERKHANCDYGSSASGSSTPLPDKKTVEAILEKIQKKDRYNVFAAPVDLDELPDYLEVIEHPMDFSTIRKKLARNVYSNLEELEVDVILVCSNAMQYNSAETVYHKQARSMQEVARKCFQAVRAESRSCETFLKSGQNVLPNSHEKDTPKFSFKSQHKIAASDTSSVAVVTINQNNGIRMKASEDIESAKSIRDADSTVMDTSLAVTEGMPDKVETIFAIADNLPDKVEKVGKVEEISEKSIPLRNGQKIFPLEENRHPVDENRRATYNISNQTVVGQSESIFSMFEEEKKQLVAVGLDEEYSYARSLARFAATLGPIAWKLASARIEKALPEGVKYGPGWVGEYEPLPMHFLPVTIGNQNIPSDGKVKDADPKEGKPNGGLKVKPDVITTAAMGLPCMITSQSSGGYERKLNSNAKKPVCEAREAQVGFPYPITSQSAGTHLKMPTSNVNKSLCEVNVEEKLGTSEFSTRQQTPVVHDLIHQQRDKPGGATWKELTIENGKVNLPKQTPNQNLSSTCDAISSTVLMKPHTISHDHIHKHRDVSAGILWKHQIIENGKANLPTQATPKISLSACKGPDSAMRKPPFQMEAGSPGFQHSTGYRDETKLDSLKGMWISKHPSPLPVKKGLAVKVDAASMGQIPTSMDAESLEKDAVSSCSWERRLSGSMSSSATTNSSHASHGATQVKSVTMLSGVMSKVQNYPNLINGTRQFIPTSSPTNHASSDSGTIGGDAGVISNEPTPSTPIDAWISIGNCSERKLAEAPEFLKVQPKHNIFRPTSIPSAVSGMQQATLGRQLLPPSNPYVTNGKPTLPVSNWMYAENIDVQNSNLASTQLIFGPETSRSQHMFPWRGPVPHIQQRKSEDMLPPDLNIVFQSPGSPVQLSSGIHVDSQPDLALQL